jgi:hypothetical protein
VTRAEANQLLDRWREGQHFHPGQVRRALFATGDLAPYAPAKPVDFGWAVDLGRPEGWHPGPRVNRAERRERAAFVSLAATVCAPLTVGDPGISGG